MSYLNYNIGKTFSLLLEQFRLSSFISITLSCILFGVILYINKDNKIMKYIFIGISTILLGFILVLYLKDILKFNYIYPLKNINMYFLNSIIYLIIILILNKKIFQNKINLIFYVLTLIGIVHSIYMTIYLKSITIIVIGNIFPEILFGNLIILINYIVLIMKKISSRNIFIINSK